MPGRKRNRTPSSSDEDDMPLVKIARNGKAAGKILVIGTSVDDTQSDDNMHLSDDDSLLVEAVRSVEAMRSDNDVSEGNDRRFHEVASQTAHISDDRPDKIIHDKILAQEKIIVELRTRQELILQQQRQTNDSLLALQRMVSKLCNEPRRNDSNTPIVDRSDEEDHPGYWSDDEMHDRVAYTQPENNSAQDVDDLDLRSPKDRVLNDPMWMDLPLERAATGIACKLAEIYFTLPVLRLSNLTGRDGRTALDDVTMQKIAEDIRSHFGQRIASAEDFRRLWKRCRDAIGGKCRHLRHKRY